MPRSLSPYLRLAILLILCLATLPVAASSLTIDIEHSALTPQPQVLALKPGPAADVFAAVEAIEPDAEPLPVASFTLIFPWRPSALETLQEGWRLVAATDHLPPSASHPASPLYRHGIMARVVAITPEANRWVLKLEGVQLEEIIESGSLSITAAIRIASSDASFPDERLFPEGRFNPEWRWLDASFHGRETSPTCHPGDMTADLDATIPLSSFAEIEARYLGALSFEHSWQFQGGELTSARLEGEVCQASQLRLTIGQKIDKLVPLWHRTYGPTFHMVGWLPLMLEVKGKLGFKLDLSSELTLVEPLTLHHEAKGTLVLEDGDWDWASPPSQESMHLPAPSSGVTSAVDISLSLLPRMELVLYSMMGPYLQAEASRSLCWQPSTSLEVSQGFRLAGGLTHRTSRWGDWTDTLYRTWPKEENIDKGSDP
ncbi:hypothetical protein [Halomonas sp. PBN3]|uniref:hypothetical protein n=1 Tax=Halomonas sp. PBN3 TaxID=1397528 RepID=UPI0003B8DE1B|nr:hypothetical protein [Halomonas sp. PBN3]ERS87947.1 hypothetical protein Q671_08535 [Halomonas sp. PBN3]